MSARLRPEVVVNARYRSCDTASAWPGALAFQVLSTTRAPAAAIAALQRRRLTALLESACELPYHRAALAGRDLSTLPLQALPPTTKAGVMRHFADTVADARLGLAGLRNFCADPATIGQPFDGRCWAWESSGSSGEPGLFVQDMAAMAVYDALEAVRRHTPQPWARMWDPLALGERVAFVGAIEGHFASIVSLRRQMAAYPWLTANWRCFSILQPTADLVAQLNEHRPTVLATYPTAASMLAGEAQRGRLQARPQEVWTGGETLSPALRRHVEQAFGAVVRNSYGASEFLPIAWECAAGRLHVNADWVILEAVDARHRPVAPGALSHTTLLTNLANHLQPLIRVDIGDRIRLGGAACACGCALPLVEVQGRCDDMLDVAGRGGVPVTLLPLALSTLLEDRGGVFDFQLQQTGACELLLRLGPGAPRTAAVRETCRALLLDFAAAQGAERLRVRTQAVAALPAGRSGKRCRIVALKGATAVRA